MPQDLINRPYARGLAGSSFRFIDLFAGIGGLRLGFEEIGGQCVFASEWNRFSRETYPAWTASARRSAEPPPRSLSWAAFGTSTMYSQNRITHIRLCRPAAPRLQPAIQRSVRELRIAPVFRFAAVREAWAGRTTRPIRISFRQEWGSRWLGP